MFLMVSAGLTACNGSDDHRPSDGPIRDGPRLDRTGPATERRTDAKSPKDLLARDMVDPFCTVTPRLQYNSKNYSLVSIITGIAVLASCCPPGEFITLEGKASDGQVGDVTLEVVRMPGTPSPSGLVNIAAPPTGWQIAVRCGTSFGCGLLRSDNAVLKGTLDFQPLQFKPGYLVTTCVTVTPKAGTTTPLKQLRFATASTLLSTACLYGQDKTCNQDSTETALKGECTKDSNCNCIKGAKLVATTGKCL